LKSCEENMVDSREVVHIGEVGRGLESALIMDT
jgi:hypothetical protein